MSLIGQEARLIMDFKLYKRTEDSSKKDEGELTVAKRLLSRSESARFLLEML